MTGRKSILYLHDEQGNLAAVQIPAALWKKIEPLAIRIMEGEDSAPRPENLDEFAKFMSVWDFPYPYDPAVECPNCHAATSDWRGGKDRPFCLANATLGGLLVFHCQKCGATIRHKYFKDHMALECTPRH